MLTIVDKRKIKGFVSTFVSLLAAKFKVFEHSNNQLQFFSQAIYEMHWNHNNCFQLHNALIIWIEYAWIYSLYTKNVQYKPWYFRCWFMIFQKMVGMGNLADRFNYLQISNQGKWSIPVFLFAQPWSLKIMPQDLLLR